MAALGDYNRNFNSVVAPGRDEGLLEWATCQHELTDVFEFGLFSNGGLQVARVRSDVSGSVSHLFVVFRLDEVPGRDRLAQLWDVVWTQLELQTSLMNVVHDLSQLRCSVSFKRKSSFRADKRLMVVWCEWPVRVNQ